MDHNLELGDLVLCTVDRIIGTVVFVKIEGHKNLEGGIVTSEIAPGRIRNLRDYVVPKKKIVCKVLRLEGGRIDLSLRRVTLKEQKEVIEKFKQEQSYTSILKKILGERSEKIIAGIEEEQNIYDFLEEGKKDTKKLEKLFGKEESSKILSILNSHKQKNYTIKKIINLKTTNPDGINLIRKLLSDLKNIEVKYIAAGKYALSSDSEDPKKVENFLRERIEEIEKSAKKLGVEFAVKEK